MTAAVQRINDKVHDAPRDAARPYRLWDAKRKQNMRWRYYSDKRRAHMGALIEARWAHVGDVIEVYDARTGRMLGQYIRMVDTIRFIEGGK